MTQKQQARHYKRSFTDPVHAARRAGLHYVRDDLPGIHRKRQGKHFVYLNTKHQRIHSQAVLKRIDALVIPPAWNNVWICPDPLGHIQATGFDTRGRKQYRYHPLWRKYRDRIKYHHVIDFAQMLPDIRRKCSRHLQDRGLTRRRVLAATVRVMDKTLIRVGHEQYTRNNHTYGLSTLEDRHVKIKGATVRFDFRAKHGVRRRFDFQDKRLASIIRRCRDLPGEQLFQYRDETGTICDVTSTDINAYLKQIGGNDFSAKDFRTWAGTVLAAQALAGMETSQTCSKAKKNIVRAVKIAAMRLGNTTAVCRKCYIHPAILDAYLDGSLVKRLRRKSRSTTQAQKSRLTQHESAVLNLLKKAL